MSPFSEAVIVRQVCHLLGACGVHIDQSTVARWTPAERSAVLTWTEAYIAAAYSDTALEDLPALPAVLRGLPGGGVVPTLGRRGLHGAGAAGVVTARVSTSPSGVRA